MNANVFTQAGKILEESFYARLNQELLDKYRQQLEAEDLRAALAYATGIKSEHVLDSLLKLGIRPVTLTAISLVPLVEVAWCDGKLSPHERESVLQAAKEKGCSELAIERLSHWLDHQPPEDVYKAWRDYIGALVVKLPADDLQILRVEIMGHVRDVADAAGGILGLGRRISPVEAQKIQELDAVFDA